MKVGILCAGGEEAEKELIELSKTAVSKMKTEGKVFWGRMVTGESFRTNAERQKIIDNFAPLDSVKIFSQIQFLPSGSR